MIRKWLQEREKELAHRWIQELRSGKDPGDEDGGDILEILASHLVSFLPACFGKQRERGLEVWQQVAYLYGSLALLRGLAAGEVVDELQLLRTVILRAFLSDVSDSGSGSGALIPPMEFLNLNRVLDLAVSRASISYVDDLFFTHLQGSGVPRGLDEEHRIEIKSQLDGFRNELAG